MVRWCAAMIAVGVLLSLCAGGVYGFKVFDGVVSQSRTDIVNMDSSSPSEPGQRPDVLFYHDLHTDSLLESNEKKEGCKLCHTSIKGKDAFRFIPVEKKSKDQRMTAYHERCIGCHSSYVSKKKDAGPMICSGCHVEKPAVKRSAVSARFDKSLHQRHSDSLNKSCESCHHLYNPVTKKRYYKKGKEGSCSYCHADKSGSAPQDGMKSDLDFKQASHLQCITCHETRYEAGKKAGPRRCEDCHDPNMRKTISKAPRVSRLDMGQKDFMMLKNEKEPGPGARKNRMNFVPFDHKNHEMNNESCRVCHHKSLTACVECHTVEGSAKGGHVILEKVMHQPDSERSCSGCHEIRRKKPECSGCHSFDVNWVKDERKHCVQCHAVPELKKDQAAQASAMIESRIKGKPSVDISKIPENIVINKLEKNYQPVQFPHRKIVNTLYSKISKNSMAQYFHHEKATLCMGCHHNSPATDTPTACRNCHNPVEKEAGLRKPGLLGAYHIQCMECHAQMNIRQPESCTACHKEKK